MAISTTWVNFVNGATGAVIRAALNTFNTQILADMVSTEGRVSVVEPKVTTNISDIAALDVRVTGNESDIVDLENPVTIPFVPQVTAPTHVEGQVYYDQNTGSFKAQGPIPGIEISVGHDMHIHVVNNSGALIEKGSACRHDGVAGGIVQVVKAKADSFNNARVFGVAQADIANGASGAISTFGSITGLDTTGYPTGVPLYLSDTIAGTYSEVAPDIVTQVGGGIVQDAITGEVFVSIINNTSLPTVLGGLKGHTTGNEVYAVTTTAQDLDDFAIEESIVTGVDALTGVITVPNTGEYRTNFTASIAFPSSASTRTVTFELYDVTGAAIQFAYTKNIPRDATEDSLSFSYPFSELLGNQYKMRIKSNTAISVTFSDISFDIESVNIR